VQHPQFCQPAERTASVVQILVYHAQQCALQHTQHTFDIILSRRHNVSLRNTSQHKLKGHM
jgi:hypothetical protein